jgi:cardiolipin synthase A/B
MTRIPVIIRLLPLLAVFVAACTPYVDYHAEHDTARVPAAATGAVPANPEYRTGTLAVSPDGDSLDLVLSRIASARERVWLATYILSEKRVIKALEDAHARGADVRVLLEPAVYNLPTINRAAYDRLSKSGISVGWIRSASFGLHHAKYLVADGGYVLSTANFSHSSFTENREYFFAGDDPGDTAELVRLFEADATGAVFSAGTGALVTSPETSRSRLEAALSGARESVDMAMQSMSDPRILTILRGLAQRGVRIRIVLGGADRVAENASLARTLSAAGMTAYALDKPYVHAKALAVDGKLVYVGSVNFTPS